MLFIIVLLHFALKFEGMDYGYQGEYDKEVNEKKIVGRFQGEMSERTMSRSIKTGLVHLQTQIQQPSAFNIQCDWRDGGFWLNHGQHR